MSTLEALIQIAQGQGDVLEMARELIGKPELALLIAKTVVEMTTEKLSPTKVSEVLGMTRQGAGKKIDNTAIKTPVK